MLFIKLTLSSVKLHRIMYVKSGSFIDVNGWENSLDRNAKVSTLNVKKKNLREEIDSTKLEVCNLD